MAPRMNENAINWIDGMKLNKNHFIENDNWIQEKLRGNAGLHLTDYNYGLVKNGTHSPLELLINIDQNNQMNIKVTDCLAITKGGRIIEINAERIERLQYPLEKLSLDFSIAEEGSEMFDIILAVFPDRRVPVGIPNENEIPFRHPWVMPEYQIQVVPTKQVNTSQMWNNHITIGKFQVVAREVHFYTEYIPPCTRIDVHPSLIEFYNKLENNLEKITNALAEYLRKYRTNQGKLETNISYVFERLVYYLTVNLDHYKLILKSQPPVFMIEFFVSFARLFKSALSWLSEYDREEVLNHFSHYVSSRDIDNAAFELVNLKYDHQDIYYSLAKVESYVTLVYDLFEKMVFSGKQAPPVRETRPSVKQRHGPVIIRDGKQIN